jgi:hypothetical protein
VARHAADDARIAYHRHARNLGMVASWNACLERAPTDRVTLLHADDRLLPGYAELVHGLARRHPGAVALFCGARIIDARGHARFSFADAVKRLFVPHGGDDVVLEGEDALHTIMAGNFIMCPTLCLRRSRLGARRFDTRWRQVQDLALTSRLLMDGERLAGARQPGYAYRRHEENATALQSESLLRFREEFALFDEVARRAAGLGWPRAARTARRARIVRLHLAYRALGDVLRLRAAPARAKLALLARHRAGARPVASP